ncbi:MAG: hypothetical protein H6563_11330 [Lewinellaceae bacterium]|nr:hypothetical protein [Lewinellaceae bacterium]
MEESNLLTKLFKVPKENRDESWMGPFLNAIPTAELASEDPQVLMGPDGFPYFGLYTPKPGQDFEPFSIQDLIPQLLLRNGIGVAINPSPEGVDWVFSYGDILNWHLRGAFYSATPEFQAPVSEEDTGSLITEKMPDDVLPMKAREVLRAFLKNKGVARPKAFLLTQTTETDILRSLVFNIFEEEFESTETFNTLMEQIQWFLPKHYFISRVPNTEDWLSHFSDL